MYKYFVNPLSMLDTNSKPVFLINFNWLATTKKMFEICQSQDLIPFVIDNGSTYPPLLDWYKSISGHVIYAPKNIPRDQRSFWHMELDKQLPCQYYAVSDADLDINNVPSDWFNFCIKKLHDCSFNKVGLSLSIDNLPTEFALSPWIEHQGTQMSIQQWEGQFWTQEYDEESFIAPIDTTLAVYDKTRHGDFYAALRTKPPYTVIHIPWTWTVWDLNPELTFFLQTANQSTSNFARIAMKALSEYKNKLSS